MKRLVVIMLMVVFLISGCSIGGDDMVADGNSLSNSSNVGLFYGDEGSIYFSNWNHAGLFKLDSKDGNIDQLLEGNTFINLIVDGDWLYYVIPTGAEQGIYRMGKNGSNNTKLISINANNLNLSKDYLYFSVSFQDGGIYKMSKSGGETIKIIDEFYATSLHLIEDWIYYINNEDFTINRVSTDGKVKEVLADDTIDKIVMDKKWIYYFDNNNLSRISHDGRNKEIVTESDEMEFNRQMNVKDEWVYVFARNPEKNDAYLYRINTETKEKEILYNGLARHLHIIDDYIYFYAGEYNSELQLKKINLDGSELDTIGN
ncbi:DUF5050 domain-containing protein [Alkaliphilus transvaalensis]|uniref:DUF5050 domain-containing protein n=1 Tax=Alkaliphilus transvaalensis TaxID=114628 RepID=UPI00047A8DD1|nr:DUF5050 domain-containing protein [Alkaliphilus transvaalensis]